MTWRKWLVRGLVFSVLGGILLAGLLYEAWTNPTAMRQQVLDKLAERIPGATVALESARLRLLGGIGVGDLRLARRDALDKGDFLYVPSAVIYHDKEHLLDGALAIRKFELHRPRLRIVRERDGGFNLSGLLGPTDLHERVPTLVIQQGTIVLEDRRAAPGVALLEITDVQLTIVNDPLSTLTIEGNGQTDVAGPVRIRAALQRASNAATASVEFPAIPFGPPLVERLHALCPDLAAHLRSLKGTVRLSALLAHNPDSSQPLHHDVTCSLTGGAWSHARLPVPLEQIEASVRCLDGHVPLAQLTARSGETRLKVTARDLDWPGHAPSGLEEVVGELHLDIKHLPVAADLFDKLPGNCQDLEEDYQPRGRASVAYDFQRTAPGHWHKQLKIEPEGMAGLFNHFRYPFHQVTGSINITGDSEHNQLVAIDLAGRTGGGSEAPDAGRPLTLRGEIRGEKPLAGIDLVLTGDDVPLDEPLFLALPPKSQELTRKFLSQESRDRGLAACPLGRGDFKVFIRRPRGEREFVNRFVVSLRDAAVKYDVFPYPLEQVSGVLDIQPDHWECQNFRGNHKGGTIFVDGRSIPLAPAGAHRPERQDRIEMSIRGRDILLDDEFEQALAPPEFPARAALRNTWHTLALGGRLSFAADVVDRPDQPQDIDVGVNVHDCTMRPAFFPYALTKVGGAVHYGHGRVTLRDVHAQHGPTQLRLRSGRIDLKPQGGFLAWFSGIGGEHLVPDADFFRALHPALQRGLAPLQLHAPLDVQTDLAFDAPSEPGRPLKVWWDGGATLHDAVLQAGLEVSGVNGQIACMGHHNGQQFDWVSGHVLLDRATVLHQPFRNVQARVEVRPDSPDVVRLYDLKASLFGGTMAGEARIDFAPSLRYEVLLEALHVQLEEFGKHNNLGADAQLQGPARAALSLQGEGADLSGLRGNGRVEVANGKMYKLPVLLDLLKAFGLRMPDRTAFEQARMLFSLEGPQMRVSQLDLMGSAISLRGAGTVDFGADGDTNLNLDFSADWGRVPQMLPPGLSDLSQAFSDQVFKIKMRGKIGAIRLEKEFIPAVVEPFKKVFGSGP
jgi:hypothetical protein